MVTTDETKWVAWGPCSVTHIHGYNPQAGTIYIQLFQQPTVTAGDVPVVKSLLCPAGQNFFFDWDPAELQLSELFVALSSTEANYTAITANAGLDLTIVADSDCLVGSATTLVGDLTTGVASLTVWADVSGPKRLLRADIKNNSGAPAYAFISGDVGQTLIQRPMHGPFKMATGETIKLTFGRGGLSPVFVSSAGVKTEGCEVIWSDDSSMRPEDTNAPNSATSMNIRAIYE